MQGSFVTSEKYKQQTESLPTTGVSLTTETHLMPLYKKSKTQEKFQETVSAGILATFYEKILEIPETLNGLLKPQSIYS